MATTTDVKPGATALAIVETLPGLNTKLLRRLREQSDPGDLTPSQASAVLRLEAEGPMTTSGLARAEGMRPQSMGAVVAALDAAGLLASQPDPADGRQTLLSLNEQCREWLKAGRALRQTWLLQTIEARLTAAEQKQLAAVLPLLQRIVD